MKLTFAVLLCFASSTIGAAQPSWLKKSYKVDGRLQLPYAEIDEPFTAYYDPKNGRSRVDYYDGMVVTIQREGQLDSQDFGSSYKIAPMSTDKFVNVKTCFLVNGTDNDPVSVQSVLPDLSNFTKLKSDKNYEVWQTVVKIENKKSTYTMTIKSDGTPVHYEMMGYDSLLGSHYDKYVVIYESYAEAKFNDDIFVPDKTLKCDGFPGPGVVASHVLVDPISELVHRNDKHFSPMFEDYKQVHKKNYKSDEEHSQREHNFRHNIRFIHSKNRAGLSYSLAVNHMADMSLEEMKSLRGYRQSKTYNGGLPFDKNLYSTINVPDQIDWRLYGAVTPVKDQAVCGSCWSFGSTGAVEGAYFLKTGNLVRLSQQALIDCSWGEGNNGCDGGEDFRSFQWIMKNGGLPSEEDYGHYLGQDGYCHVANVTRTAYLSGYVNVTSGDSDALKQALALKGPCQVAIDASRRSFSFYSSGVYYDSECSSTDLDHSVLAVGYGALDVNGIKEPYWLVKNSWSTYWGNDGYVLISQKNNNCGVATEASYVIIA